MGYLGLVVPDDFFQFPSRSQYKTCDPLYEAIYGPGHSLNKLRKGLLNVATSTFQMSRLSDNLFTSPLKNIFFSLCDPDLQRTETI